MDAERERTDVVCRTLMKRLSSRGLLPVEIHRLIRDVSNITQDHGDPECASVARDLARLGWREPVMDEVSFELIVFILENDPGCAWDPDVLRQGRRKISAMGPAAA